MQQQYQFEAVAIDQSASQPIRDFVRQLNALGREGYRPAYEIRMVSGPLLIVERPSVSA